jgi:hypothetical protein
VDDVEPLAAVAAAQVVRRTRVAARREGEDLDVHARHALQGRDLVADEAAALRRRRAGPHARDDEGTHLRVILHRVGLSLSLDPAQTRPPYRQSDFKEDEMGYRMMGRGHAALMLMRERLRQEAGQGTVEYVALILLVAAVMGAVVIATTNKSEGSAIAKKVTDELKNAIDGVGKKAS